ncbi:MAG: hypothetical protein V1800_08095 [Candidatus Latescibacterota bacterium]
MTRRERWLQLIDRNLDYLFRNQGADGSEGGDPGNFRGTVQMAHAASWAFLEPRSRHYQQEEAFGRARKAMDLLAGCEGWKTCPFTPSYFGETLLLMEPVEGREMEACREALRFALGYQRQTGNHTPGHFSDWDVLYALSLAIGGRLFGDEEMKRAAGEHAQLVWASMVPGGEGFYYLISPFQFWPPSVNYTGITTATFARYYEVSGDVQALEMVRAVKDYYLYYTEPWGLTEFTVSPWHKHTTDTKEDTFAFVAASAEFLAQATQDRRLDQVAELMLQNLEGMVRPDGDFQRRIWEAAWINATPYDANTTGYMVHAANWCKDGKPEPLPDSYISRRKGIHAFKARQGDFGYSVVCGESYVSLCGAWAGRDSLLQEVVAQVSDEHGLVFGQMAPLWRKQVTCFPDGFAQTAYYQPAEIIGDSWGARYAQWRVYQTYVGTREELVGFISLESLADQTGRYAAVDFHIGPAGQKVHFGAEKIEGEALVSANNDRPILLSTLTRDSWVQYGRLGIFLRGVSGRGMAVTCWDPVARSRMFHDGGAGSGDGFASVISNDLVISCATPEESQFFEQGARYSVLFAVTPAEDEGQAVSVARSGRYSMIPTGIDHTFAMAIDHGERILLVLVTHQPWVKPVLLRHRVPEGTYRVRVYAEERGLVLKEFTFSGRDLQVEVATASPTAVVEVVRENRTGS